MAVKSGSFGGLTMKNWCLWIVVLEKINEISWIAGSMNHSVLDAIKSDSSVETLIMKLKLRYFEQSKSCWKLGKNEGN